MTTFAELMAEDDVDVFINTDEHAQSVTYNGTDITAVVGFKPLMDRETGAIKRQKTLWVKADDVADPAYRDTVTINGVSWDVGPENEFEGDDIMFELPLYRDERPQL